MDRNEIGKLLLLGVAAYIVFDYLNQVANIDMTGALDFSGGATDQTGLDTSGTVDLTQMSGIDTSNDQDILARTIYGEARGEGANGQIAVACVVMNRVRDPKNRWPKTPAAVCLQPLQFSCWNSTDPNYPIVNEDESLLSEDPIFTQCQQIASSAIMGQEPDITGGAQFYFNPALARPSWASAMTKTASIGNQVFYREA